MITKIRKKLWKYVTNFYPKYLRKVYGMNIGEDCKIAWSAHLDKSINPKGIHIGKDTSILREAMILSHDNCRSLKADTFIGDHCVIGVRSIVLPGVKIGNNCIIGG